MQISNLYVVVEKVEEEKKEGFQIVEVTDSSLFKGRVTHSPDHPIFMTNDRLAVGDIIVFSKYSPDTHDIELEGKKYKFVAVRDILAKL